VKKTPIVPLLIAYLVIFCIGFIIFISFRPNFNKLYALKSHYSFSKQRLLLEEKRNTSLQKQYNGLSSDPECIEEIAREKLGWSRPTETVIRFQNQSQPKEKCDSNK
jgi:uncharacterized membrane protein